MRLESFFVVVVVVPFLLLVWGISWFQLTMLGAVAYSSVPVLKFDVKMANADAAVAIIPPPLSYCLLRGR